MDWQKVLQHLDQVAVRSLYPSQTHYVDHFAIARAQTVSEVARMIADALRAGLVQESLKPEAYAADGTPLVRPGPGEAMSN